MILIPNGIKHSLRRTLASVEGRSQKIVPVIKDMIAAINTRTITLDSVVI